MRNRKSSNRGGAMLEFALLVPVWVPLLLGTLWIGSAMIRSLETTQVARDAASMFCRGADFTGTDPDFTARTDVLPKLVQDLGTLTNTGTGVIIFSTLTYAGENVCALGGDTYYDTAKNVHKSACTNHQQYVITQRFTVGNKDLRASNFGDPVVGDPKAANQYKIDIADYLGHSDNRAHFTLIPNPAENATDGYQSGQPVSVVEVFFSGAGQVGYTSGGNYAYAIF